MSDLRQTPDDDDVAGHRLAANDNETIVQDDPDDVVGHRIAGNDNETIVQDDPEPAAE